MSIIRIAMRLLIVACVMAYGNLCLYAADGNAPIQTRDQNVSPEKTATSEEALTLAERVVIARALEMTTANLNQSKPVAASNLPQTARTTSELADSINRQLNSRSPQDRPPQNEVPYEVPLTPSLPELQGSTPPDREEEASNLPEQENLEVPTRSETTNYGPTSSNPPYFEYSDMPNKSDSIKKSKDIESLIDFISEGGTSLNPVESNDLLKNRSWSEALDLKLLELENERNETQVKLKDAEHQEVIVLDDVNFTPQIRGIYQLLNPPARLHPWLKWLLYSSRINPQMLELYYSALRKRDQIYMLAAKGKGKLKIRYRGRIVDIPVFVWPDQAQGLYELVMIRRQEASEGKLETPMLPRL